MGHKQIKYHITLALFIGCHVYCCGQIKPPITPSRIIQAPRDSSLWEAWKNELTGLRASQKKDIQYSDSLYSTNRFRWASHCYSICMLMLFDQQFYNPKTGAYNVDRIVKEGLQQFGGYDGIVLWHAYPRIGFDQRNQFDYYREIKGLKSIVARFHKKGLRVFIDYNPWDSGTIRAPRSDAEMLAEILKSIDADGVFLDTMNESSEDLRKKLDSAKAGTVLESELELPTKRIYDHHMSWAQWFDDSYVPGVLWDKWFERRHMAHLIRRWDKDHTGELQTAWMNGCGMIIWENVFGTANKWDKRDKSIIQSMLPVQRRYASIFSGEGWDPLYKINVKDVFANEWHNGSFKIWTLINRSNEYRGGELFKIKYENGISYYDLISGKQVGSLQHDSVSITAAIRARGVSAIIAIKVKDADSSFMSFLRRQASADMAYNGSTQSPVVRQLLKPAPFVGYQAAHTPRGMCLIKKSERIATLEYSERECGFYDIPSELGKVETKASRSVAKTKVYLRGYAMDSTPVTNAEFYQFMNASHYQPADEQNFLKAWVNGQPAAGSLQQPVVYVNLDDARAYAKWSGKRLPTEQEWQYAAEGPEQFLYPWGNDYKDSMCNNGRQQGTTPVREFPAGRSPFGCYDMCGNTWEWTESERTDGMTRFCILKGGSWFKARASEWYADGGAQKADFAAKFIFISPGLDRCATVGFRCAVDVID